MKKNRILLYFPRVIRQQKPLFPPLETLALGSALIARGFRVSILDQRLQDRWWAPGDLGDTRDLLFVGISSRPGLQTLEGLRFARWLRRVSPDTPIVWGGWGPSAAPQVYARDPDVDFVVVGDADRLIVSLAETISDIDAARRLPGIAYAEESSSESTVHINHRVALSDISTTVPMSYDLVDVQAYLDRGGTLGYLSSRGCSGECTFCAIKAIHHSNHTALPAQRVIDEVVALVRCYGVKRFSFLDVNFFDERDRALEIATGFVNHGLDLSWDAFARIDQFSVYSDDDLALLARGGCSLVSVGVETASQGQLDAIDKGLTIAETRRFVEKLAGSGIRICANIMFGLPGETREEFLATVELARWIRARNPCNSFAFYPFSPIPSTAAYGRVIGAEDDLLAMDIVDLGLSTYYSPLAKMRWLDRNHEQAIKAAVWTLFRHYFAPDDHRPRALSFRGVKFGFLHAIARFRVERGLYALPLRWWARRAELSLKRRVMRRRMRRYAAGSC